MLLTVDDARLLVTTTLGDDALRLLLDASEEAIDDHVGKLGSDGLQQPVAERFTVHGSLIVLSRRASSITSIVEDTTTLAENDWNLATSGTGLRRLTTGTNPASYWLCPVTVTYTPLSDIASRQRAQVELLNLYISYRPGVSSQSIGPWAEAYGQMKSLLDQHQDILASIGAGGFEGIR